MVSIVGRLNTVVLLSSILFGATVLFEIPERSYTLIGSFSTMVFLLTEKSRQHRGLFSEFEFDWVFQHNNGNNESLTGFDSKENNERK